jgi:tRNA 2-thiouridine synthesizing protein A
MSEIEAVDTLDLRGLFCPMPIVMLTQSIGNYETGAVIEVLATDPGTLADIPAWAKTTGNEVLKSDKVDKIFKFYIKKLK